MTDIQKVWPANRYILASGVTKGL